MSKVGPRAHMIKNQLEIHLNVSITTNTKVVYSLTNQDKKLKKNFFLLKLNIFPSKCSKL